MEIKKKKIKTYHLYILLFIFALIPLILFYYNSCGGTKYSNLSSEGNRGGNGGTGTTGTILLGEKTFDIGGGQTPGGGLARRPKIDFLFIVQTYDATRKTKYLVDLDTGAPTKFTEDNFLSIPRQRIDWEIQVLRFGDLPGPNPNNNNNIICSGTNLLNNNQLYQFGGGTTLEQPSESNPEDWKINNRITSFKTALNALSNNRYRACDRTIPEMSLSEIIERTDIRFRQNTSLAIILISGIDDPELNETQLSGALAEKLNLNTSQSNYKFHSIVKTVEGSTSDCYIPSSSRGEKYINYSGSSDGGEGVVMDICSSRSEYTAKFEEILRKHGAIPVVENIRGNGQTLSTTPVTLLHEPIGRVLSGIYKIETNAQGSTTEALVPGITSVNINGKQVTISPALAAGRYKITYSYRSAAPPAPPTSP